jgi:hypothetical protein
VLFKDYHAMQAARAGVIMCISYLFCGFNSLGRNAEHKDILHYVEYYASALRSLEPDFREGENSAFRSRWPNLPIYFGWVMLNQFPNGSFKTASTP